MIFTQFLQYTKEKFPYLGFLAEEPTMTAAFVSESVVTVSLETLSLCRDFIRDFRKIADHPLYREQTVSVIPEGTVLDNPDSALLCFDFYITPEGPRLIEVNTNGAGYPTTALLYAAHELAPVPKSTDPFLSLRRMFEAEWGVVVPGQRVVIVDEDIFAQRTMFEFKSYQALFQSWGYVCDIVNLADLSYEWDRLMALGKPVDKVYNRCCDFYLTESGSRALARAVLDPNVCVSPHPSSYALMADKGQMIRLSQKENLEAYGCSSDVIARVQQVIPPVRSIRDESPETWWAQRKKFFFKPQNTYGSKAVYKGESMSRKKFETLLDQPYVVQPYFQAGVTPVMRDGVEQMFRYDLRFFVYGEEVLMVAARLFQGQVTNFQTPGGGFAPVTIAHG